MDFDVISVGLKHSGNLGALARVCDNFNVRKLILVSPFCEVDSIAYERATKSRRYLDNITIVSSIEEARNHTDLLIALSARIGSGSNLTRSSLPITKLSRSLVNHQGSAGIVLGREDYGLSNEEVDECDILTNIPLPGENPVMNISHAASLALWELIRDIEPHHTPHKLMNANEKHAFLKLLKGNLTHSWIKEDKYYGVERVFLSILGRALVTKREANALIGTMRGINRSLEGPHPPWDDCGK